MSKKTLAVGALWLSASLLAGCGGGHVTVGYRAYDPYYSDYHMWDDREGVYYNQWIVETHRPHRDYRRLRREDQRVYWQWRHNHH